MKSVLRYVIRPARARLEPVAALFIAVVLLGGCTATGDAPSGQESAEAQSEALSRRKRSQAATALPTVATGTVDHTGHTLTPPPPAAGGAGTDPASMTGMGPFIDMSSRPTGDPGVSSVDIRATSERPAPGDGTGAFRTTCEFSHMLSDDPIVFPGQEGKSHLHAFFGNTLANAKSTADSVKNSGNSTCRGGIANRSAYWVPAVVDAYGVLQKPVNVQIYYKTGYNGIPPNSVKPFPSGLRMIAGNAKSTSAQDDAYWGCNEHYIGHPGSIPNCAMDDQVVMHVEFPQCWNGRDLDSADHTSHMAYPQNGKCPSTHPVAVSAITFNIVYAMPSGGTAGWRLVSDMYDESIPGGYSAHGDWFDGWDQDVMKAWVKNCNNRALDCHSHLLGDGRAIFYSGE